MPQSAYVTRALQDLVGIRLRTVSVHLRLIPMLLDKLEEHPDNLESALDAVEESIKCLGQIRLDLKGAGENPVAESAHENPAEA